MGHHFVNSIYSPDVYNVSLLVDLHTCGQRNSFMFPKSEESFFFPFVFVFLDSYLKTDCCGLKFQ